MKRNKSFLLFFFTVLLVFVFSLTASANSSWHWISSARPFDLLPVVIIFTLIIEIVAVNYIAKVKSLKTVIPVISIANLVSFAIPYLWVLIEPGNAYIGSDNIFSVLKYTLEHTPVFTVSFVFLAITLLAETPIVYLFFRKKAPNKKILFLVIIAVNIITTAIAFAVERIFCHGEW